MTKSAFWKTSAGVKLASMLQEYGDKNPDKIGYHSETCDNDGVWIEINFPNMYSEEGTNV